jgi:hypothetical protein
VRRLAGLLVVAVLVLVFGVGQLVLPGIAAHRIRSQLGRYGEVRSVSVSAFPAVTLLWHHADSVSLDLASFHGDGATLTQRLDQLGDAGTVHAAVTRATVGLLTVRDAHLVKHGSSLIATARVTDADLRAALPIVRSVTPVAGGDGGLTLRGTADVLGQAVTADFSVRVLDGRIVVSPDLPLGGIATLTAFSDPGVRVTGVTAARAPGGFTVRATGTLR